MSSRAESVVRFTGGAVCGIIVCASAAAPRHARMGGSTFVQGSSAPLVVVEVEPANRLNSLDSLLDKIGRQEFLGKQWTHGL